MRCPRAGRYGPSPGGLGISLPALGPVREVLTGLGQAGAGNARGGACETRPGWRSIGSQAPAKSQEAWPGLSLGDQLSPWREPRWNAGRRARSAERAPQRRLRRLSASAGVPLPFLFSFCRSVGRRDKQSPERWETGAEVQELAGRIKKSRRGNDELFSPLPACGERSDCQRSEQAG